MCASLKLAKFLSWPMGLILLAAPAARAEGPPPLDEAILKNAPRIIDYLKKHSYKNTGVLKFLVQADAGRSADSVGPLNRSLADRLQVALILANDDPNLGFLTHASDSVAETGVPVTHRTAE